MDIKQITKRIIVYTVGLLVLAFGVVFAINSNLGVSPVTSLPFIISLILDTYVGRVVTVIYMCLILFQIILLRKNFKWINLTQIIFATIFGYFVDTARVVVGNFYIPTYFGQLTLLGISIVLIALGITLFMEAKLVPLPAEGVVAAFMQIIPNSKFHVMKMAFDIVFVVAATVLSFLFLGELHGVREGTIMTAVLAGKILPVIKKKFVMTILAKIGLND